MHVSELPTPALVVDRAVFDRNVARLAVSDEHVTFTGLDVSVGDRIRLLPAHLDPTVAKHERMWVLDGDQVIDEWPVDLRGW